MHFLVYYISSPEITISNASSYLHKDTSARKACACVKSPNNLILARIRPFDDGYMGAILRRSRTPAVHLKLDDGFMESTIFAIQK